MRAVLGMPATSLDSRLTPGVIQGQSQASMLAELPGFKNRNSRAGGMRGRVIRPYPKDQRVVTLEE